ncbi:MAG: hypothetical protein B7X50_03965 [Alishewanella sp. 34-51-39]|nr:MAG: hypothetical protein B7X50_03965 [Alishewanella sp. 34-51-39]
MESLSRRNHPLRDVLDKELQQRTFGSISAPCRLCHFMLTVSPALRSVELTLMQQLAQQQGKQLSDNAQDLTLPLYGLWLRWERHGEFSSYTFIRPGQSFNADNCISSELAGGQARIWTDFQKHAEGAGRMLLLSKGLTGDALGRLAQQLFDLGNYRKLSLLGWPLARQSLQQLSELELQLAGLTQSIELQQRSDEQLLHDITGLAAATERLIAENSNRLQATAAYYQLTLDRLKALQESPLADHLSLQDFTEKRLTPAYRTSEAVQRRQQLLSSRLGRCTELLRTRLNLKLEQQNQQLLSSMEQKAKLQLKLQQMVEGFSLVAISYYAVQLAIKLLSSLQYWWPELNVGRWQSIAIPVIIIGVAGLLRYQAARLKRSL